MDFYNFEKNNDVFCFEKISFDYQPLFRVYKDNYKYSLSAFLKEYEENTEQRFIESQLYFCTKEINVQKSIIRSLEILDVETFYYIRNRINPKYIVYTKKQIDPFENESEDEDEEIINMHSSAENFIKFITNRITSLCLINEFLEDIKNELAIGDDKIDPMVTSVKTEQNPFDNIFTGNDNKTFKLFETFAKYHVLDKFIDFSFIFQQMKYNGYIADIKHLKFMDWLRENEYLSESEHSEFKIEKSFRSLKKCAFGTRVDLYLKLQKSIILSSSDLSE